MKRIKWFDSVDDILAQSAINDILEKLDNHRVDMKEIAVVMIDKKGRLHLFFSISPSEAISVFNQGVHQIMHNYSE